MSSDQYTCINPKKLTVRVTDKLKARFWSKVDKSAGPDACWPWEAATDIRGYGWFQIAGKMWRAHAVAYRLVHGEPEGGRVLHRCDNPPCCNPAHLFPGTHAINNADCAAKGRTWKRHGERNPRAYLTEEIVRECRRRHKPYSREDGIPALAREFNVGEAAMRDAVTGRSWKHL